MITGFEGYTDEQWANEKYRDIVMNVSPDEDSKKAGVKYQVTVRFVFTALTNDEIIDLLFDASSLRVKFQNHNRGKGIAHLKELASMTFVPWKVQKSGTKIKTVQVRAMTPEEFMSYLLAHPEKYDEFMKNAKEKGFNIPVEEDIEEETEE